MVSLPVQMCLYHLSACVKRVFVPRMLSLFPSQSTHKNSAELPSSCVIITTTCIAENCKESDKSIMNVEPMYDEKIHPLMTQIIAICNEHGIPFVASFQLTDNAFEQAKGCYDGPLMCSSTHAPEGVDVDRNLRRVQVWLMSGARGNFSSMIIEKEMEIPS